MTEPLQCMHAMPYGAEVRSAGGVRFRLWAPAEREVALVVAGRPAPVPMSAGENGWHELLVEDAVAGDRYCFALMNGTRVPDPASRFQPEDVHAPSEVIDPRSYAWSDGNWRGRPWEEAVLYELHLGAFTPEGTYRAAIDRLDHLLALGVTAVELMPVAAFPGARNWGYDGVYPFAPDASYGRPDDLRALVDAAHRKGLMVFLDVVYNHFGPEGNYLHAYAPAFFTDRHQTPWGAAINFDQDDSAAVRGFMVHNALYWLEEFRFDGLRLDAVHAIIDSGERHLLEELAEAVHQRFAGARYVHLVLENGANEARFLPRGDDGRPRWYTAQWTDDVHHALHVAATHERAGYYAPFTDDIAKLGRALAEGFAFQGEPLAWEGRTHRGEPSAHLPPTAFVGFIQNHDQVGNRAFGDRLTTVAPADAVRTVAAIYLLAPQIPMLFMGEEWGASQPFPFFCDFGAPLADAVREGRRAEFAHFPEFSDEAARAHIPDPVAESTFVSAKLAWDDLGHDVHREWLAWYRAILAVRREKIVPLLAGIGGNAGSYRYEGKHGLEVAWRLGDGRWLQLLANLAGGDWADGGFRDGDIIWQEGRVDGDRLGPWSVLWTIAAKNEPDNG